VGVGPVDADGLGDRFVVHRHDAAGTMADDRECVGGVRGSGGTLAQYVLADARLLAPKPRTLFMRKAAALPLVAITAHEGMTRGGVLPAHRVLIHGGAGGVGHVAIQLAAALGAKIFPTISAGARAIAMRLGATDAVDYRGGDSGRLRKPTYRR
jgi:NADPH:quinone reductase